jgi:uncharacterized membrane protein
MIRIFLWIVSVILLGSIVHLATILLLPYTATKDAFTRLSPIAEANRVTLLPTPAPNEMPLPFMDPAFATAVCRYDLKQGPVKLQAPVSQVYTSVSFYTPRGIAYYAINDRAGGRRVIELDLMTPQQRSRVPDDEEITAADRLIVESPTETGLIVVRALAPGSEAINNVRRLLNAARCQRDGK